MNIKIKIILIILLILLSTIFGYIGLRENSNLPFPYGMCPYEYSDDFVLSDGNVSFTIGNVKDKGILKTAILKSDNYDILDRMNFLINNEPVVFHHHEFDGDSIVFYGEAGDREVNLRYSLSKEKSIILNLYASSDVNERIILKVIMSICDLSPVVIRDNMKGMNFIQGRDVAYLLQMDGSKSIFTSKGLIVVSRKISKSDHVNFSLKFYVDEDIEKLKNIIYKHGEIQRYVVLDESKRKVKHLRFSVERNGKILTVSTTDDDGILSFRLPKEDYEFNIFQMEGYRIKYVDEKRKTIILHELKDEFVWFPYTTAISTNSVYVNFKFSKPATAVLTLSSDGKLIEKIEDKLLDNYHSIRIGNLKPNTIYNVLVYVEGKRARCTFKTLGAKNFKFVVYADTRTNYEWHKMVADRIKKEKPLFVINVGDLVDSGDYEKYWDAFFKAVKNLTSSVPYFTVLGNHERNSILYYFIFMNPKGGGDFGRRWYSFNSKDVHFVILDSNVPKGSPMMEKQTKWLIYDLERNKDKKFKIVLFHHPFYTNTPNSELTLEEEWRNIFEKYGVNIVFNGHIHDYERFVRNGIHYVVTGGGGAPLGFGLYSRNRRYLPWSKAESAGFLHYVLAEVKEDKIEFTVKSVGYYLKVSDKLIPMEVILDKFTVHSNVSKMSDTSKQEFYTQFIGYFQ